MDILLLSDESGQLLQVHDMVKAKQSQAGCTPACVFIFKALGRLFPTCGTSVI